MPFITISLVRFGETGRLCSESVVFGFTPNSGFYVSTEEISVALIKYIYYYTLSVK